MGELGPNLLCEMAKTYEKPFVCQSNLPQIITGYELKDDGLGVILYGVDTYVDSKDQRYTTPTYKSDCIPIDDLSSALNGTKSDWYTAKDLNNLIVMNNLDKALMK